MKEYKGRMDAFDRADWRQQMYRDLDAEYEKYVENVKRNIDKATAEGILRDDCSEGYSYASKETWLRTQANQEAQDYNDNLDKK
jgi:hypothetical protein